MMNVEKKIFTFDNYEGDKGIIIADSYEEAAALHKKEYPYRNPSECWEKGGVLITEFTELQNESRLYVTMPW